MSKERIIGIDFGTSTSVIRVKNYDENGKPIGDELDTKSVTFNHGATIVPSLIRKVNDAYAYGYDAKTGPRNAEYFDNFKLNLQDESKKEEAKQFIKLYFKNCLHKMYSHQLDTGNLGDLDAEDKTIVSYPVKWDPELEEFMIEVAKEAGFKNVSGMNEAEASICAFTVQCKDLIKKSGILEDGKTCNVMLIDMGAGTTDIVISKYTPGKEIKNEIIATWPKGGTILFGGCEVDTIIRNHIISMFPDELTQTNEFKDIQDKKLSLRDIKKWKEDTLAESLEKNGNIKDEYYSVTEKLEDYFNVDCNIKELNRETFEALCHDYISKFVMLVSGAIEDSGLKSEDIDVVILTGGHSSWYFVKELLLDKNRNFEPLNLEKIKNEPARIFRTGLPQETVALGLAYSKLSGSIAFDKRKHLEDLYDNQKSIPALKMAASMESPYAINELGYYYATGEGGIAKNTKKAEELYQKAADMGLMKAWYNLGCLWFERKWYKKAIDAFKKAAKDNIPEAIFNLAICYQYGLGTNKDNDKAGDLYSTASELGYKDADKKVEEYFETGFESLTYAEYNKDNTNNQGDNKKPIDLQPVHNTIEEYTGTSAVKCARFLYNQIYGGNKLNSFYIGGKIPETKVNNFLSNYPQTSKTNQKYICYQDSSISGNGKTGFLITDKYFFERQGFLGNNYYIAIKDIKDVIVNPDTSNSILYLVDQNGKQLHHRFYSDSERQKALQEKEFLKKLISFINDNQ